MRVLHFAHTFVPQYGGTTTRLLNLLSDPADTHFLYVPFPSNAPEAPEEETFGNIEVRRRRLWRRPLRRVPFPDVCAPCNALRLAASVRDARIDLFQGHNPSTFVSAAQRCARRAGVPFIYEAHRLTFDMSGVSGRLPSYLMPLYGALVRRRERRLFLAADAVIVQTPMHRERLLEAFPVEPTRVHVIPMGVDEVLFDPARYEKSACEEREQRGWTGKTVFLYNGQLARVNGTDLLLQAVRHLPPEVKRKVQFVFLGRGPLDGDVLEAAREYPDLIEHVGLVDYAAMPLWYAMADVVLVPVPRLPHWERNHPTKMIEGMAMRRIVLGSDVSGVTDLLEHGRNGMTYRAGSVEDMVRAITEVVSEGRNMDQIRAQARETVVPDLTWSRCREQLQTLYQSLAP